MRWLLSCYSVFRPDALGCMLFYSVWRSLHSAPKPTELHIGTKIRKLHVFE